MKRSMDQLTAVVLPGLARSSSEIEFAATTIPCATCGSFLEHAECEYNGNGFWITHGVCPGCGAILAWGRELEGKDDHYRPQSYYRELRGQLTVSPEPSRIISPEAFVAALDRTVPWITYSIAELDLETWHRNDHLNRRAHEILSELLKFPGDTVGGRPREELVAEFARQRKLSEQIMADRERIESLEPPILPRVHFGREMMRAHELWVSSGRNGPGPLNLEYLYASDLNLGKATFCSTRLEKATFSKSKLGFAFFDDSELIDCDFSHTHLGMTYFQRAVITRGTFEQALAYRAVFDYAVIDSTSFNDARLLSTFWDYCRVTRATFRKVAFAGSRFDHATFEHCDFTGSNFDPKKLDGDPTSNGAHFVDCTFDGTWWARRPLSNTRFTRCKVIGISGRIEAHDGLVVEDCDLTREQLVAKLTQPTE